MPMFDNKESGNSRAGTFESELEQQRMATESTPLLSATSASTAAGASGTDAPTNADAAGKSRYTDSHVKERESQRIPLQSAEPKETVQQSGHGKGPLSVWISAWWSQLTFQWFTPVLHKGNAAQHLEPDDLELVPLPMDCHTSTVYSHFERHWEHELAEHPDNPSLIRALVYSFGRDYGFAGLLKLVHDCCIFVGPAVLHGIIVFLRNPHASWTTGMKWTVAVTVSQTAMSIALRHYFFQCYVTGLRIRTALTVAVYRKALKLSATERQSRSLGEITNLMSIDAQRLQDLTTYFHSLWSSPLQIALALFFLWRQLGPSSLGGVSVILIMIPVTKGVASWMGVLQKRLMTAKDRRVELNGEVLAGMKVIKFQAWEEPFQERILQLRDIELGHLFRYYIGTSFSRMLWTFTPLAVALATFAVYVHTGHKLDVASALTSLTLFEILRFPLFMLPQVINNTVEALVSLRRIREFLLCREYESVTPGSLSEVGVRMRNVSAVYETMRTAEARNMDAKTRALMEQQWEVQLLKSQLQEAERKIRRLTKERGTAVVADEISEYASSVSEEEVDSSHESVLCLRSINFDCKPGELVAVVGGVGCGKSSFISAILGEVRQLTGTISVRGRLAYFSQIPFIMNATVRDNILFSHVNDTVDEELYQRSLQCCALMHDLALLPSGDETEIGEKGLTLSGGQKARIALARAVYHRADVTLIDDALSAVDAHVAAELFEKAIVGELLATDETANKRSVVLVTNAIQYLNHPRVSRIIVLQEGQVVEAGPYRELAGKKDSVFARFLSVLNETDVSGSLTEGCSPEIRRTSLSIKTEKGSPIDTSATTAPVSTAGSDILKPSTKLMTEEARMKGNINLSVYLSWFQAAGHIIWVPVAVVIAQAMGEVAQVLSNWWLTYWSAHGESQSQRELLSIYAIINLATAVIGLLRNFLLAYIGLRASRKLFADMLKVVLNGKMSFFDTTPVGRLINRFSRDIYVIDEQLTTTLRTYSMTLFSVFSTLFVISGVTPIFTICLVPMCLFYVNEQKFFTLTYRELKRLDSVNRSPIFALLGETVDGVATVRAFSAQESLRSRLVFMLDQQQHAYFLTCAAQSWLAVRLELVGTLIITFACLSAVLQHTTAGASEKFAGLAGLSISYALSVTQALNWTVRMAYDLEANFVSVERVKEYTQFEKEAARHLALDETLPSNWPPKGEILFENAQLRYRPELPLVLKGLNLLIPAGSKVGVVGRTGAGKSTLMVALTRMVELSGGRILIDGTDTSLIGLSKLRRNLAVIPQDPVLFSGTLRSNLDPFNDFRDEQLYETLEKVGLYKGNSGISGSTHSLNSSIKLRIESLDDHVAEGGSNFSVGQRQLIVIGRALLRGARIVVIDEATASVDSETDAAIQVVMRREFTSATCITVAHRINTILDSDYILVMDDGKVAEFDEPTKLLRKGGLFRDLVKAASHDQL